ncbi:BET1 homolog [Amphibalanus amphitrite]|uniref:BET1 homolog n=1 Tax=Amphibalanus amphitrite TaxID=1232801 RepID=UPI001C902E49|nr:BET1 homolog [Amphibalanus amphitrite]XP_043194097.1 BET1 homolog [Amphibalanus amphitrite]
MRRPNFPADQPLRGGAAVEEENDLLESELKGKVSALKSLTIDIGHEVRYQNKMLNEMDDEFDSTGGLLGNSMKRVMRMARSGHNRYLFYLFLFSLFVFLVIWLIIRSR